MNEIYQNVENMHKEGYLTLTEKNKLTYTLNNFKDLNINYFNQSYNSSISTQLENEIISYNSEQLKILNNITLDITSQSENIDDLNLLKSKITENEVLLANAKLLYMQSLKLKDQYEKSEVILAQIDSSTKSLRLILNTLEDYPDTTQKIILNDIEDQLLNLKILFKSLPYYNELVMDISKNMIKNNKD